MKKLLIFLFVIAIFLAGVLTGYFFDHTKKKEILMRSIPADSKATNPTKSALNKPYSQSEATVLKLSLLQDYINFIYLPEERILDVKNYVDEMNKKIDNISDEKISEKYYLTADDDDKETKILNFLNYTIDSVKNDLSAK